MTTWQNKYINKNQYSRPGMKLNGVKKLVLHYTANNGATAANHYSYFNNLRDRYASAHIFVDRKEALCIIPLDEVAYHANDGSYRGVAELKPNANFLSIGVEMCLESNGTFHKDMIEKTENVFVDLCKKYNLDPIKDIVRHYDITHKNCPAPWVKDSQKFIDFKNRVNDKLKGNKPSVTQPTPSVPKQDTKPTTSNKTYTSVVDYLNANKIDSSFNNRKKLAEGYGIKNYTGTAYQNTQLLDKLQSGSKPAPKPKTETKPVVKGDTKTTSVVTYLNSIGENSSFSNREKLAVKYGIKGYKGTAEQNLTLLAKLRGDNKSTPAKKKEKYVQLPKTSSSWRVYPTNKLPVKGNEKGYLNPKKFNGLEYKVLENPQTDVYTIQTGDFGKVNIYAAKSTGAKIVNK